MMMDPDPVGPKNYSRSTTLLPPNYANIANIFFLTSDPDPHFSRQIPFHVNAHKRIRIGRNTEILASFLSKKDFIIPPQHKTFIT